MAKTFSEKMDKDPHWISNVWFTDEAHFHLNGAVNNWNNRFWGDERPDLTEPKCLKGPKVTAFCALNKQHGVLGPYWFCDDQGKTVTVNTERYIAVVDRFIDDLRSKLSSRSFQRAIFMQDGASPHTSNDTLKFLKKKFKKRQISLETEFEWAPHSPDLNPLDFFFWGAAKSEIYKIRSKSLD